MYDLIDRPVRELPAFEAAVLARTRRWVHALTVAGAVIEPEDDAFGMAMRALDSGSQDMLVIERPCHDMVSETEAVLLGLWRLVRADRIGMADAVAAELTDAHAGRAMVAAMARAIPAIG
ncbi:hypothetical protein [Sphingomonas carotinifaciens]|uniref:Uncharacterized protein n=1 Tax=Sphingomonas carotinifaciens TaxID=1166323 RepID=A0A1G7G443_9SPHN|nr:hypothetical protein [Sphingomonas carotinifaciens]MBB4086372.1 hypothetical protein [Sphingomonas carotinifaciens]MWC42692.1 hypothetical protein [Sphingomonas carotinifaciens]SDE82883.1 hypothetical protein SAMN05216557_101694 [Sphingomonas carotinifaciens]